MHNAHLRALDLNLLVVLEALLRARSVTRAARELAMTQSAASHALARLREVFDDPLLQRQGQEMLLTPRAQALAAPLAEILEGVRRITDSGPPPLAEIERTLRLSIVDFAIPGLLPPLLAAAGRDAPRLTIACVPWSTADKDAKALQQGVCDMALGTFGVLGPDVVRHPLGHAPFVGLARADHPMFADKHSSPHDHPFLVVSASGQTATPLDAALPHPRRVTTSLPGFLSVPLVVAASDLLAYVPAALVQAWEGRAALRTFPAPPELAPHPVELIWHRREDDETAHRFVREQLISTMGRLLTPPSADAT